MAFGRVLCTSVENFKRATLAMDLFPLFESDADRPPQAARLGPKLRALADHGVYFGTSSWKYEGWLGTIYEPARYTTRGKFSRKKFEAECLAEYAATFPIVCGDFAFYQAPSPAYWKRLFLESPSSLLLAFKVPEDFTVARWPGHARYGPRAGQVNEAFLDSDLLQSVFTRRLEPYADRVSALIFEFGTLSKSIMPSAEHFIERLDAFFASLPRGFRYAVEIRNPEYLSERYFAMLESHGVAHVLSAWTRMPELGTQLQLPGVFTADFTVVRALLGKGQSYEQAVSAFQPYKLVQEPNEPARDAMRQIAERAIRTKTSAFIFVNNRLEGHAPSTIEAVVDQLE